MKVSDTLRKLELLRDRSRLLLSSWVVFALVGVPILFIAAIAEKSIILLAGVVLGIFLSFRLLDWMLEATGGKTLNSGSSVNNGLSSSLLGEWREIRA